MSNVYCRACGSSIHESATDCPNCGAKQNNSKLSKTAALLFCWFLGPFGGHKYYLGRPLAGTIYLLFFWTLIPAIFALVDFIVLACKSEDEINRKYGVNK